MRKITKVAQIVAIMLLLAMTGTGGALRVSPAASPVQANVLHAQPELAQLAAQLPEQQVAVIVQKAGPGSAAEEMVARLGGTVTQDLHIINAFAAEMSAAAAQKLAASPAVRWVSLDSEVQTATAITPQQTTWATRLGQEFASEFSTPLNVADIAPGQTIWFSNHIKVTGLGSSPATINYDASIIELTVNHRLVVITVPGASVTYDPAATSTTTAYDAMRDRWITRVPKSLANTFVFLTGVGYHTTELIPKDTKPEWKGNLWSDTKGVSISVYGQAAAVYSMLSTDPAEVKVKPCDNATGCMYNNADKAGTPENFTAYVIPGGTGTGAPNFTGTFIDFSGPYPTTPAFNNYGQIVDSPTGPNGTFGSGGQAIGSFTDFTVNRVPGYKINKVEAVLQVYVPAVLSKDAKLLLYINDKLIKTFTLSKSWFSSRVGAANAGPLVVDISSGRAWQWAEFDTGAGVELVLDQRGLGTADQIYYDAIGLRVTAGVNTGDTSVAPMTALAPIDYDPGKLSVAYPSAVNAPAAWGRSPIALQGQGVTVAVVDSGFTKMDDVKKERIPANVNLNVAYSNASDAYGHGTFVANILGGEGAKSHGGMVGIAPRSNLLNVRVSDDQGAASESLVVSALQWINDNRATYNIRVVNLSINSNVYQSYHTSPLDAACEILWFNGIVVVVSAGNNGTATLFPPANDPFVITVGAADDKGTASISDDSMASFSAFGTTGDGFAKPDLVAPGKNIVSYLHKDNKVKISVDHPGNRINDNYFKMSGTSMSAPMVSGAVALLLQDEPNLTPDQVKYRLMATANKSWPGYNAASAGAGYLDVNAAVNDSSTQSANTGLNASKLLWTGSQPITWGSVSWNSVSWNSVSWNSVSWNSVSWNSVSWNSDYWGQ